MLPQMYLATGVRSVVELNGDIARVVLVLSLTPRLVGKRLRAKEQHRHAGVLFTHLLEASSESGDLKNTTLATSERASFPQTLKRTVSSYIHGHCRRRVGAASVGYVRGSSKNIVTAESTVIFDVLRPETSIVTKKHTVGVRSPESHRRFEGFKTNLNSGCWKPTGYLNGARDGLAGEVIPVDVAVDGVWFEIQACSDGLQLQKLLRLGLLLTHRHAAARLHPATARVDFVVELNNHRFGASSDTSEAQPRSYQPQCEITAQPASIVFLKLIQPHTNTTK